MKRRERRPQSRETGAGNKRQVPVGEKASEDRSEDKHRSDYLL